MRRFIALGLNDLRNSRRDPLIIYVALVPWFLVLLVRSIVPGATSMLMQNYDVNLVPHYPLIHSFFFVLEIPLIVGVVFGLLLLDERDDDTLTALRVTPLSMTSYVAYRLSTIVIFSVLYILVCSPASGLVPLSIPALIPIALLASLFAPTMALLLAAFADNKVEGLAIMKGSGILMLGPLVAYFVDSPWDLLFGSLPSYWPARALWSASQGENPLLFLIAGFLYHTTLIVLLARRFHTRLNR